MNDRYDITRLLDKDHAGGVYEGEDTLLNRKVTCRRFFDSDGDSCVDKWEEQFKEYAHKLTSMQHPNIALVYDVGIDEDGAFLITSFIKGDALQDLLADKPLPEYEVYSLAYDVLEAFTMIHSQGETHGALIPSSIVRTNKTGGRFSHHIIDLGIAALIPIIQGRSFDAKNPALTAPEQLQGEPASVQTDLFMLGQLCYTLAAQGHPFSQASKEEAISLHTEGDQKDLRKLAPHISPEMATWIHSLIKADPQQRPTTAEEALESLPVISLKKVTAPAQQSTTPADASTKLLVSSTAPLNTPKVTAVASTNDTTKLGANKPAFAPTNSGLNLPTKKKSNTGLIVGIIAGVAVIVTILGIALSGDNTEESAVENGGKETANSDSPAPAKPKHAIAVVQNFESINFRQAPAKTIDLTSERFIDYIILTGDHEDQTNRPDNSVVFKSVTKSPEAKFTTFPHTKIPVRFRTKDAVLKPKLAALASDGLGKGEGWDINFAITESLNSISLNLYFYQSNNAVVVELYESMNGKERKLTSKTSHIQDAGLNKAKLQIKGAQANANYIVRVLRGSIDDRSKPLAGIGLSAITFSKK